MTTPVLTLALWNNYVLGGLLVGFIAVCVLMVLAVLIQKPQGGGLAGAFGAGASSGQTAFGTKTGDALTVFTIGIFVLFLVFAVLLNLGMKPQVAGATDPQVQPIQTPADGAGGATTTEPTQTTTEPGATTPAPATTPTTSPESAPPATTLPESAAPASTTPPASEPARPK